MTTPALAAEATRLNPMLITWEQACLAQFDHYKRQTPGIYANIAFNFRNHLDEVGADGWAAFALRANLNELELRDQLSGDVPRRWLCRCIAPVIIALLEARR